MLRYLVYIGVISEVQTRGYARRVIKHVPDIECIYCRSFVSHTSLHLATSSVNVLAEIVKKPCYVESRACKYIAIYE